MKKFYLLLALGTIVSFSAISQESNFKPFKVDVSLGYAIPGGSGAKGGVLFAFEPKYAVANSITLGLRMEAAIVARGFSGTGDEIDEVDVKAAGSYLLTGDYYFTENRSFRPFAGAGAGIFSLAAASIYDNGNSAAVGASSKFGGLIRTGFEAGHFRLGVEYNMVPNTNLATEGSEKVISKNSYIGIKLGVCIGGGSR
jgi:opacity protein-like surface antigen